MCKGDTPLSATILFFYVIFQFIMQNIPWVYYGLENIAVSQHRMLYILGNELKGG